MAASKRGIDACFNAGDRRRQRRSRGRRNRVFGFLIFQFSCFNILVAMLKYSVLKYGWVLIINERDYYRLLLNRQPEYEQSLK